MQTSPTPRKIEPKSPREIFMSWSDGSEGVVPYVELRYLCPCASCVDEHTGKRIIRRESVSPDVRPTGVQPVGRYAIQFTWSDGHATGIYPYEKLYALCKETQK